jgi:hypothetical protein
MSAVLQSSTDHGQTCRSSLLQYHRNRSTVSHVLILSLSEETFLYDALWDLDRAKSLGERTFVAFTQLSRRGRIW